MSNIHLCLFYPAALSWGVRLTESDFKYWYLVHWKHTDPVFQSQRCLYVSYEKNGIRTNLFLRYLLFEMLLILSIMYHGTNAAAQCCSKFNRIFCTARKVLNFHHWIIIIKITALKEKKQTLLQFYPEEEYVWLVILRELDFKRWSKKKCCLCQ